MVTFISTLFKGLVEDSSTGPAIVAPDSVGSAAGDEVGNANDVWTANGFFIGLAPGAFPGSVTGAGAAPGAAPGSVQNSTGWKFGDPICDFDKDDYKKRVIDRILYDLELIDGDDKIWKKEEKEIVSKSVGTIAVNMRENWCSVEKVVSNAIGGPLARGFRW